jgi:hypothetical protein
MLGMIIGDMVGGGYREHPTHSYRIILEDGTFAMTENTVLGTAVCDLMHYCREPARGRIERMIRSRETTDMLKKYANVYPDMLTAPIRKWSARRQRFHSVVQADFSPVFSVACAYTYETLDDVLSQTELLCSDVCDSNSSRKCAEAVNSAVYALIRGAEKDSIADYVVGLDVACEYEETAERLALERTPENAVLAGFEAFMRSYDFDSAVRYAVAYGAMSPTVAAVAGALAGEYYKKFPAQLVRLTYGCLDMMLRSPLERFAEQHGIFTGI